MSWSGGLPRSDMAKKRFVFAISWRLAGTMVSTGVFCAALWLLYGAIRRVEFADILDRLAEVPWSAVAASAVFSLLSYLALGGFDWLATRYIGRAVPLRRTLLASFISHAVSHTAGFAALTGGAVRYRLYSASGLSALEVGAVIMFCGWTFVVGAGALAGLALLLEPGRFAGVTGLPEAGLRLAGAVVLGLVAAYGVLGRLLRRPLWLAGRPVLLPRPSMVLAQLLFAICDLSFASAALWVLLPQGAPSLPALLGIYVLGNLVGIVAHVPGGIGVFETAVVLMLPDLGSDAVLGALLLWRAVYNLLPLALAGVLMAAYELRQRPISRLPGG